MGKFYRNAKKLSSVRKKLADVQRRNRREKKSIAKRLGEDKTNVNSIARNLVLTNKDRTNLLAEGLEKIQKSKRLNFRFRNKVFSDLSENAEERDKNFDMESMFPCTDSDKFNQQMFRSYYKEFKKVIETADVVIQVLDARDPLGTRCAQVEQAVINAGAEKRLILLLNKIDLIPRENLEKWIKYLRQEFPTVAFKASTQSQADHLAHSKTAAIHITESLQSSRRCVGANYLMKVLGNYCRNQNILTSIKVGIVGYPNVGKSSIINSLKRSRACTVGATPGITKNVQEIVLDKHIRLLDSPGVVFGKEGTLSSLALHNAVKIEKLDDPIAPAQAIIQRADRKQLIEYYKIAEFKSVEELLSFLAQRIGRFRKGGVPDMEAAARKLLNDWNSGVIKYCTEPPENYQPATHISAELVAEMSKAFDLSSLDDNMELESLCESEVVSTSSTPMVDGSEKAVTGSSETASMETDQASCTEGAVKFGRKKKGKEIGSNKEQFLRPEFQQNRARKNAYKKLKKRMKKNDKNAAALSEIAQAALSI